jgi:hypothetical protein
MKVMSLFTRILAVVNATLLALPPAWCCILPAEQMKGAPSKPAHSCCNSGHQESAPQKPDVPSQPSRDCCCQQDRTTPPTVEPVSFLVLSVPLCDLLAAQPEIADQGTSPVVIFYPPLHVLHCIWRC